MAGAGAAVAQTDDEDVFADRWLVATEARLEALDKVTGRISVLDVALDTPTRFGTLDIVVRACRLRPPELPPDSAAFLEIGERRNESAEATSLFSGWMFASSPGLSTLEHPVYDVIVRECRGVADETDAESSSGEAAGAASSSQDSEGESTGRE